MSGAKAVPLTNKKTAPKIKSSSSGGRIKNRRRFLV
jgi:hypothetical protein